MVRENVGIAQMLLGHPIWPFLGEDFNIISVLS